MRVLTTARHSLWNSAYSPPPLFIWHSRSLLVLSPAFVQSPVVFRLGEGHWGDFAVFRCFPDVRWVLRVRLPRVVVLAVFRIPVVLCCIVCSCGGFGLFRCGWGAALL